MQRLCLPCHHHHHHHLHQTNLQTAPTGSHTGSLTGSLSHTLLNPGAMSMLQHLPLPTDGSVLSAGLTSTPCTSAQNGLASTSARDWATSKPKVYAPTAWLGVILPVHARVPTGVGNAASPITLQYIKLLLQSLQSTPPLCSLIRFRRSYDYSTSPHQWTQWRRDKG